MAVNAVAATLLAAIAVHHLAVAASFKTIPANHFSGPTGNGNERQFYVRPQTLNEMCPRRAGMPEDVEMYACPSAAGKYPTASYRCIRYEDLCNGIKDCDDGEDEIYAFCMFHKLFEFQQLKVVNELRKISMELHKEIQFLANELDSDQVEQVQHVESK